ncbi:MAG: hypothetical protein WBC85_03620, partial [Planktotalea sp.]|uniref:hypothetical protein n=1 Tax=Planktotalea sp. TaxID=2029877 RepID=UPI003C731804
RYALRFYLRNRPFRIMVKLDGFIRSGRRAARQYQHQQKLPHSCRCRMAFARRTISIAYI